MERTQLTSILKRALLVAAGVLWLILIWLGASKVLAWAKQTRENRRWTAVHNLTPDRLIARCGQPVEDNSKDLFPVVAREMSFNPRGNQTIVLAFSRTAEEGSSWVFMSMRDAAGTMQYDTPEAKIAALPCLDSQK